MRNEREKNIPKAMIMVKGVQWEMAVNALGSHEDAVQVCRTEAGSPGNIFGNPKASVLKIFY